MPAQWCLILYNPLDCSPPGSSVHGIPQARILESGAISHSRDLSNPGTEPVSPASPALAGRLFTYAPLGSPKSCCRCCYITSGVSDSVRPHGRQPTRLPRPWDSPGKNTGVGCHVLLPRVKVKLLSRVRFFAIPWTAAYQAPPSMGFSKQEYWSGVPLPSPKSCLDGLKRCRDSALQSQ